MYNRIKIVDLSQKKVTFGDVITVIKLLQNYCLIYSIDFKNNLKKEQSVKLLKHFQSQDNIPEFEFFEEINSIIKNVLGMEINEVNDKINYILPKSLQMSNDINEKFLEYANKNLWKIIIKALIDKLNHNKSIDNVIINLRIPKRVVSEWYGTIFDENIKEDMDTWLKFNKIGRCYRILNDEEKVIYEIKVRLL